MANDENSNPSGNENPGNQSSPGNGGGNNQPPQRPEYIAEKFWDPAKGQVRIEDLAKAHGEAERQFKNGKQIWEQERLAQRPSTADGYAIEGIKFEGLPPDLVILDKAPGPDFKPEAGKRYFRLDPADPLIKFGREFSYKHGLPPAEFQSLVVRVADYISQREAPPSKDRVDALRKAEYGKLGEQGAARADHAWKQLQAAIGEGPAKALDGVLGSSSAIEALELLLEKSSAPKFGSTGGAGGGNQAALTSIDAEIAGLKADKNFSQAFLNKQHPQHKDMVAKMTALQERRAKAAA